MNEGYKPIMEWEPSKTAKPAKNEGSRAGYYRCISEGYGETHILSQWQPAIYRQARTIAAMQGYEFREVEGE